MTDSISNGRFRQEWTETCFNRHTRGEVLSRPGQLLNLVVACFIPRAASHSWLNHSFHCRVHFEFGYPASLV